MDWIRSIFIADGPNGITIVSGNRPDLNWLLRSHLGRRVNAFPCNSKGRYRQGPEIKHTRRNSFLESSEMIFAQDHKSAPDKSRIRVSDAMNLVIGRCSEHQLSLHLLS